VRPRLTNWKFGRDKFCREFWKGETTFVSPVRPDPYSILYTNTKLYKIDFRTNDLCSFCDNQPKSLSHLSYHCSRSEQFWSEFELYWCLISNQLICLCLENVLFRILTENACPLLQLLNYFIIIGKLYLRNCRSKQILPNIYGFRAKIVAKYETEEQNQQQRIL